MTADRRRTSPIDPRQWHPEVPGWPIYRPHRPRNSWDDRRVLVNLGKVLASIILALGVLFLIALFIAGGWHYDSDFWTPKRIQPTTTISSDPAR